jgi:hypothetical protein
MGLSIADIDQWNPEAISAVGAASTARADAASQASSRLNGLSAFGSWQGDGANAARARTGMLAEGLDRHGQDVSAIAAAADTAATEVRQIKSQLDALRSSLGQYGIIVDANDSRVVPPPNLSSMSSANQTVVQQMTVVGQQSLDKIRQAADLSDTYLANAISPTGDDFNLDTQYARPQGLVGGTGGAPLPESGYECWTAVTGTALTITQITQTKTWWTQPWSKGQHCK